MLTIENRRGAGVTLEVKREIESDRTSPEPAAKATRPGKGIRPLNQRQRLAWELGVPASKTVTLSSSYATRL